VCGKHGRVPAASLTITSQKLSGELRVIGILAERKVGMGPLTGTAPAQPAFYVYAGNFGRPRLDYKAECVTQCLPKNGSGKLFCPQARDGATSRPQCLQTFALARIRSAQ
jgi:hypothetical protein